MYKRQPEILKEALELGKSERYVGLYYWWQPSVMLRICKAALVNRIEIEYVHHLIRARNLIPEEPSTHLENLSLIHISEPTRLLSSSYAVLCLKQKKTHTPT